MRGGWGGFSRRVGRRERRERRVIDWMGLLGE